MIYFPENKEGIPEETITVSELIACLQKHDSNLPVLVLNKDFRWVGLSEDRIIFGSMRYSEESKNTGLPDTIIMLDISAN